VNDSITGPRILNTLYSSTLTQNTIQNVTVWVLNSLDLSSVFINPNGSNYSMANNTAYNFTFAFTAATCGSQSFKIFSNDTSNAGVTNTTSYTVTGCCGDSSCSSGESCSSCATDCGACSTSSSTTTGSAGGGGGGGGTTPTTKSLAPSAVVEAPKIVTEIFAAANPDSGIQITLTSENIPMSMVDISLNSAQENIEITIEALDARPAELESPEGVIYQYLEFSTVNLEDSAINSAVLEFYIPNTWFQENAVDEKTIHLLRFKDTWQELPTEYLRLENAKHYYTATTEGFSYFAITGEKKETTQTENITALEEQIESQKQTNAGKENTTLKYIVYGISLFLIILFLILFFIWFEKRKE